MLVIFSKTTGLGDYFSVYDVFFTESKDARMKLPSASLKKKIN